MFELVKFEIEMTSYTTEKTRTRGVL